MTNYIQFLKENISKELLSELSDIKFIYKGFHNYTFKAKYKRKDVQVRIPISNLVNHDIEAQVLKSLSTTLFYENGILIREWFDGKTLEDIKLTKEIQLKVIKKIKQFHQLPLNVPKMDFHYYKKGSEKYADLVKKYTKDANLVTSHCDLSAKNILINETGDIELIDFEWVRKAHPFFDAITLVQSQNFNTDIVKTEFCMTDQQFEEITFISDEFRQHGYESVYSNFVINGDNKKIGRGLTNLSYVQNDLFIQIKQKNEFNHLNKLSLFDKLKCNEKVIFENENMIIRKYINSLDINFGNEYIITDIAKAISELHCSRIKLKDNVIRQRIEKYIEVLNNHRKFNLVFTPNIIKTLLTYAEFLTNDVPSHNDLNKENILLDNTNNIKFIDFEYSSMNSIYFDLSYCASALELSPELEIKFLNSYSENSSRIIDLNEYHKTKALANFYGIAWSLTINPEFDFSWLINNVLDNLKYFE
ncbi:phosphotransferase [Mycoplasma zalophidermidis]|uniref:Phosphotransferase n=1 Tax=Mycoplasma zalophidermidis TaxID=398174 RepID=A0ABS6DR84_9MOLU|nr:phosphotransferase [Mycoplasma zalophidermidis]MBU4689534.1 phosphotransferase [Mycoplasma zalophidermidis]MBU4693412.1 phosphotransferase [Mycoplasma zalophidermidis]MCR8966291.1 phosphotransferase [Mycoplasma zalophidermidis]